MADFGQSFADSFSRSFEAAKNRNAPFELARFKNQMEVESLKQAGDAFKAIDQEELSVQNDRTQGMEIINNLSQASKATPTTHKAIVKNQINRFREGGVPITPEAEQIITSMKPEESEIFWRNVSDAAQQDPEFGAEKIANILSDPKAVQQFVIPLSIQTQSELNQKNSEKNGNGITPGEKALQAANSKRKKEITLNENKLNALKAKLQKQEALFSRMTSKQQAAVKPMLQRTVDEMKRVQGNIDNLNKGALESETRLAEHEFKEGVKDKRSQFDKDVQSAIDDQLISEEEGNALRVAKLNKSAKDKDEVFVSNPDGTVTIAKGNGAFEKAGKIKAAQLKAKKRQEINSQKTEIANQTDLTTKILNELGEPGEGAEKLSITGALSRVMNTGRIQLKAASSLVLKDDDGKNIGNVSDLMKDEEVTQLFDKMGIAGEGNARLRAMVIQIAYQQAKILDPSGRVSDKDFKNALDSVGFDGNPDTFREILISNLDTGIQRVNNSEIFELGNKQFNFRKELEENGKDMSFMDIKRKAAQEATTEQKPEATGLTPEKQKRLEELRAKKAAGTLE